MWIAIVAALPVLTVLAGCCALTQPGVRARKPSPVPRRADPVRLEADVLKLAVTFAPRHFARDELDRAADWIRAELEAAGGRVVEQPYEAEGHRYRNLIASFGPEDGERVIVGAHYDVCDELPGADDNASGVAGLLELARLLGATKNLARRVDLVAYTLEEPPFFRTEYMGSWVHAASLKKDGVKVRAQVTLEMIGFFSDAPNSQEFPVPALRYLYPTTGNSIAIIGKMGAGRLTRRIKGAMKGASDLPVLSMNGPASVPGVDFSDHRSYWAHGYPAVMITDTAFYRNANYHTAGDTPDTLNYERMGDVVDGVFQAVLVLAGERPVR